MTIAIGGDHAGFSLKGHLAERIEQLGYPTLDCGTYDSRPCDYPDIAWAIGEAVIGRKAERGILVCGSGVGAAVAANKIRGIRAGLCHDCYSARQAVEHDDINVLCLGSRVIGVALAQEIVTIFLRADFSCEQRHMRRLEKIARLESTRLGHRKTSQEKDAVQRGNCSSSDPAGPT